MIRQNGCQRYYPKLLSLWFVHQRIWPRICRIEDLIYLISMKLSAIISGFAAFSAPLLAEMEPVRSLEDFRWEHRLLVAYAPTDQRLERFETQLDRHASDVLDRKLVVLILHGNQLVTRNLMEPLKEPKDLRRQMIKRLGNQDVALIGLDGGTKASFDWKDFALESVFAQIDAMPMRQQELRERE